MRSFAERKYFTREARAAFYLATWIVEELQPRQPELRCHELAAAMRAILLEEITPHRIVVELCTGSLGAVEHSWLRVGPTHEWPRNAAILDVYTVGRLPQVQLIDSFALLPEFKMYKTSAVQRDDVDQVLVTLLICEMREAIKAIQAQLGDEFTKHMDAWVKAQREVS